MIPEGVPTSGFKPNRWALTGVADPSDCEQAPPQGGSVHSFATADTAGCSCEQIIVALDLGKRSRQVRLQHQRHGDLGGSGEPLTAGSRRLNQ